MTIEHEDESARLKELAAIAQTRPLLPSERIERWRLQRSGEETEHFTDLLCDLELELKAKGL